MASAPGAKRKGMSSLGFMVRAVLVVLAMIILLAGEYKVLRSYTRAHRRKGGSPTGAPKLVDDDVDNSMVTGDEPAASPHKAAAAAAKAGAGGSGRRQQGDSGIKQGEWRLDPRLNKFVMMTYSKEGKEEEFKKKRGAAGTRTATRRPSRTWRGSS